MHLPDIDRGAHPDADHSTRCDAGAGHEGHERLRHDEPGGRRGVRDDRPDRQVEVVAVLVRREDRGDADEATLDRPSARSSRSGRGEGMGRSARDRRRSAGRCRPGRARRSRSSSVGAAMPQQVRGELGGRRHGRAAARSPAGREPPDHGEVIDAAADWPPASLTWRGCRPAGLPEVGGHRVACGAAVMGGDRIDDPLVLAPAVRLASIQPREDAARAIRTCVAESRRRACRVAGCERPERSPRAARRRWRSPGDTSPGRRRSPARPTGPDSRRSASSCTLGELVGGRPAGGELRRLRLDHQADLVELLDVPDRDRGDDGPATWRHRDQALGGHLVHGVANRRDAHAERGRDLRRGDPLAGLELATKDPAEELIVDLPLERSQLEAVVVGAPIVGSVDG